MKTVEAALRRTLVRLDSMGEGGSAVAVHVSAALDAARGARARGDLRTFRQLDATLWPADLDA